MTEEETNILKQIEAKKSFYSKDFSKPNTLETNDSETNFVCKDDFNSIYS